MVTEYSDFMYHKIIQNTSFDGNTVVHICSSHLLKTVLRKSYTLQLNANAREVVGKGITALIHCTSLEEAITIFRKLAIIFASSKRTADVITCIRDIEKQQGIMEQVDKEEIVTDYIITDKKDFPQYKKISILHYF